MAKVPTPTELRSAPTSRQGVRQLDFGVKGPRRPRTDCLHRWDRNHIIGHREVYDEATSVMTLTPILGKKCLWCGEEQDG